MANRITNYKAKDAKEMSNLTRMFRCKGYQVVTFGQKVRELEKDDHTIIITKEK